jgi:hypothetical protein
MVEVWPFMERSRGIAIFQLFGRLAGFFTTFVNPIGLENIAWKWLVVYCCWLFYEFVFVYFLFPETANRTLEELAFCKCWSGHVRANGRLLTRAQCLRARSAPTWLLKPWRRPRMCITRRSMLRTSMRKGRRRKRE